MGLGGFLKGVAGIATSVIPGTWDDRLVSGGISYIEGRSSKTQPNVGAPAAMPRTMPRTSGGNFVGDTGPCAPGQRRTSGGNCVRDTSLSVDFGAILPGGAPFISAAPINPTQGFGDAVMGRYGAALQPAVTQSVRRKCPRGSVLGNDGLCYDHLPRGDRMWIPARKPLLTGGERNAIKVAARAGGKIQRAQKDLKKASKALGKAC